MKGTVFCSEELVICWDVVERQQSRERHLKSSGNQLDNLLQVTEYNLTFVVSIHGNSIGELRVSW